MKPSVPVIATLLFAATVGTFAFRQVQEAVRLANVRVAAYRIQEGLPISGKQLRNAREATMAAVNATGCGSATMASMVVVALFDAGVSNQALNYQAWSTAHRDAKTVVARGRHCLPLSGNLVLRDTLLDVAIAEDPETVRKNMILAQQLAPLEEAQVIARLRLWKSLSPVALFRSQHLARRDIAMLLMHADRNRKFVLYDKPSPAFQALVLAVNLEMQARNTDPDAATAPASDQML